MGRYHKNYPAAMRRRYGIPTGSYTEGLGVVRGYQRILSTDPTIPVMLQLPKWAGRQVLFQDPAGTVAVESIGDPIGGVRHPITGEIIVVQETDADRPAWGGVEVGASMSGTGFLHHVQDPSTWIDFAHQTGVFTIWSVVYFDGDGDDEAEDIFSLNNGGRGSGPYMLRESRDSVGPQNALRVFLLHDGSMTMATAASGSLPPNERMLVWMRGDGSRIEAGVNGDALASTSISYDLEEATESVTHAATIGEQANPSNRPRRLMGDAANAVVHSTELSIDDLQSISEGLL